MAKGKITVKVDLTSDEKFKTEMQKIKDQGYVRSHRSGDTGVGKTLEDLLDVEENSVQAADLGEVELKANRSESNSMITLVTKSPNKRGVNNKILREKYGYHTDESNKINPKVKVLHTRVNGKDFNTLNGEPFMKLTPKDDRIYLEHAKDGIIEDVYWDKERLKKAFDKKYPAGKVYHVQAKTRRDAEGNEEFYYDEASSLSDFNAEKMIKNLENGDLSVDIRLGIYASGEKEGKPHDNGTAIRVSNKKLDTWFNKKEKLL
ncbi:MAG: hypothetical protein IJ141_07440 [Lachnospiraceae bacterium]|nr:hypothetical protein [Lachnospiraceae bacterium]